MPSLVLKIFVIALLAWGCGRPSENGSTLHDIFTQDTGQRRHKATSEEMLWTISMGGCTGHLLNTQYMMTANHCSPSSGATYTSGSSLAKGGGKDITVAAKTECSSSLDYCILKITWKNGSAPADQNFPSKVATAASQVTMSTQPDQGDFAFTVGFPGDQKAATYAEGQLKKVQGNNLVYNIGIINGNSGGGVWRKSDKMLVSLTNNGPNALNQGSWKNNDVNDSSHWNHGAAMWNIYNSSNTLKTIFPNGTNTETPPGGNTGGGSTGGGNTGGGNTGGGSTGSGNTGDNTGGGTTMPGTGDIIVDSNDTNIYVALEHKSGKSSPFIWISAPATAFYGAMCVNSNDCEASSQAAVMSSDMGVRNGRKLFKFAKTTLKSNMKITFVVSDAGNQLINKRTVTFNSK